MTAMIQKNYGNLYLKYTTTFTLNNRKFASKIIKYYEKWLSNHNIDYVIYIII